MRFLVTLLMITLGLLVSTGASKQVENVDDQQSGERQARWLNKSSDQVETTASGKPRLEQERRQVQEFLTTKNIFKSIMKLLFGNKDDSSATSRHVLGIIDKMLYLLKNSFGQKSRVGSARTIGDSLEDAASAGVSILQGHVRSMLASDDSCVQKHLCQASREATRDSRDLGYIISSVGGYVSSYLLDHTKSANFKTLFEASAKGRSGNDDCSKLYSDCSE